MYIASYHGGYTRVYIASLPWWVYHPGYIPVLYHPGYTILPYIPVLHGYVATAVHGRKVPGLKTEINYEDEAQRGLPAS